MTAVALQIAEFAAAWLTVSVITGFAFGAVIRAGKGNQENPNG